MREAYAANRFTNYFRTCGRRRRRRAADRLFVSQPALSQRLHSIEEDWGTIIFIRSKRGLALTPAGEEIAAYAKETLLKEEEVKEAIASHHSDVYGTLKLAVTSIIGQYWLPQVLKKFLTATRWSKYPLLPAGQVKFFSICTKPTAILE